MTDKKPQIRAIVDTKQKLYYIINNYENLLKIIVSFKTTCVI